MTVFVNGRFLCQKLSGVQRFAGEILSALDLQLSRDTGLANAVGPIVVVHPDGLLRRPDWRVIPLQKVGRTNGHIWEQGALYHVSKNEPLISLGNAGPVRHKKQMIVLHDANIWDIPDAFSSRYKLLHKTMRPILAARAKELVTVSRFSADALAKHLNVSIDRFSIIPNGSDHILDVGTDTTVLDRNNLRNDSYLLCVGNLSPNKNIERLIQAHALAGAGVLPLVVVGGAASGVAVEEFKSNSKITMLGRVNDDALRSLYENAAGFVFPSLYEGFGIPPLEAMQLGTPVLASNSTAMPEILNQAAMFFNPRSVDEMTALLLRFSRLSTSEKKILVARGHKVSAQFTWEKSAGLLAEQILALKAKGSSDEQGIRTTGLGRLRKVS
ncbi:MAG: glycosyltransferase family 1 protein [Lentilitoribacter sp.]